MSCKKLMTVTILLALLSNNMYAQAFKRTIATREKAPEFVLVQLPTEKRKIEWFSRNQDKRLAEQVRTDAAEVRKRMVADINDNFRFCPVYYYYDTNAALIKAKKFNGIVLNKDLKPAGNATNITQRYQVIVLATGSATTSDFDASGGDPKDAGYSIGRSRHRLVVLDEQFLRVKEPAPNGMDMKTNRARRLGRKQPEYTYTSPEFDIYYLPYAQQLSQLMTEFYANDPR